MLIKINYYKNVHKNAIIFIYENDINFYNKLKSIFERKTEQKNSLKRKVAIIK